MFWSEAGELIRTENSERESEYLYEVRYFHHLYGNYYFRVMPEEFDVLLTSRIIEIDTGGERMRVYRLTNESYAKTQLLIRNRRIATSFLS